MQALIIGGGAREHALAWKIKQSPLLEKLYLWGANDGFSDLGEIIDAKDYEELAQKAEEKQIDIAIIGPEKPLAEGIVDIFALHGIRCIGSNKFWTQLESSKLFAKNFLEKYGIKTAKYQKITENILPTLPFPIVIKADGLCAGKGVTIVKNQQEAKKTIAEYLDGKFAEASKTIVAEEFLDGEELSLISLFDGETLLPFIPARDFKKLKNNDEGPNTGGMGAFCPVDLTAEQKTKLDQFSKSLESALREEKADFTGVIYAGLIWAKNGFWVLEFNMRFGDPETQALMMNLDCDLLPILDLCTKKQLKNVKISWKKNHTGCLVIATNGYPGDYKKNAPIKNIPQNVTVFYAGVKKTPSLQSFGGRVLSLCNTEEKPYGKIYEAAKDLEFSEKIYRTDIEC